MADDVKNNLAKIMSLELLCALIAVGVAWGSLVVSQLQANDDILDIKKAVSTNDEEIDEIKKDISGIKANTAVIANEQKNLKDDISDIEANTAGIVSEQKSLKEDVQVQGAQIREILYIIRREYPNDRN